MAEIENMDHLSDDALERYLLGKVLDDSELAQIEQHILACVECIHRAKEAATFLDALRAGIIGGEL